MKPASFQPLLHAHCVHKQKLKCDIADTIYNFCFANMASKSGIKRVSQNVFNGNHLHTLSELQEETTTFINNSDSITTSQVNVLSADLQKIVINVQVSIADFPLNVGEAIYSHKHVYLCNR